MKDRLKFCVFAVASAIIAYPVGGMAGLVGVVVALVALRRLVGDGKPSSRHGGKQH